MHKLSLSPPRIIEADDIHYENAPIQNVLKISPPKTESFQIKILIFFHISAQNTDCSNEYHNLCFGIGIPCKSSAYDSYQMSSLIFSEKKKNKKK